MQESFGDQWYGTGIMRKWKELGTNSLSQEARCSSRDYNPLLYEHVSGKKKKGKAIPVTGRVGP
jgi:hypothetical protein